MSSSVMAARLLARPGRVTLRKYRKLSRGLKKALPKRKHAPKRSYVSVVPILDGRKAQRKTKSP